MRSQRGGVAVSGSRELDYQGPASDFTRRRKANLVQQDSEFVPVPARKRTACGWAKRSAT